MAALVSGILWLHFCKVWGSGDSSSIFIYDIIKSDPACSKDELWILREHVFVLKQTWPPTSCLYMLRVWWNPGWSGVKTEEKEVDVANMKHVEIKCLWEQLAVHSDRWSSGCTGWQRRLWRVPIGWKTSSAGQTSPWCPTLLVVMTTSPVQKLLKQKIEKDD